MFQIFLAKWHVQSGFHFLFFVLKEHMEVLSFMVWGTIDHIMDNHLQSPVFQPNLHEYRPKYLTIFT